MKDFSQAKRHTMTLALIRQMRVRARDDIAEMFIRRLTACHNAAQEELKELQARQRELSDELVAKLELVLELLAEDLSDEETGRRVRELLAPHGSLDHPRTAVMTSTTRPHFSTTPMCWSPSAGSTRVRGPKLHFLARRARCKMERSGMPQGTVLTQHRGGVAYPPITIGMLRLESP